MKTDSKVTEFGHTEVTVYADSVADLPEWATEDDLYKSFAYLDGEFIGEKCHYSLFADQEFDYYANISRITIFMLAKSNAWCAREQAEQDRLENALQQAERDHDAAHERLFQCEYGSGTGAGWVFLAVMSVGLLLHLGVMFLVIAAVASLCWSAFFTARTRARADEAAMRLGEARAASGRRF